MQSPNSTPTQTMNQTLKMTRQTHELIIQHSLKISVRNKIQQINTRCLFTSKGGGGLSLADERRENAYMQKLKPIIQQLKLINHKYIELAYK